MLLSLLIYGYATGCYSSRKIERATYDSLAFRFIAANSHPDHDTLSTFRRRFAKEFEATFVQVLQVARANQLSRFGTVSLDGTKIHANASRHSALSYGHAEAIEAQLKGEVQQPLALAEEADGANVPDGMSPPEELKRRADRLAANDKQQVAPMLEKLHGLPEEINRAEQRLADAGYFSEGNVSACEAAGIEPSIAIKRDEHHPIDRSASPLPRPPRQPMRPQLSGWPTGSRPAPAGPPTACVNKPSRRSSASSNP